MMLMRFLVVMFLIALLSFALCLYLPWWSVAFAGFLVAICIPVGAGRSFLAGFIAVFCLWAAMGFFISNANGHLLAHKVSLLILKADNPYMLMLVTGLIGGLVAGLGSLSGGLLRSNKGLN